jgi:hypothetical protein
LPKPSFRAILPDYILGIGLGIAAGLLSQLYVYTDNSLILALALFFGAMSVLVLGSILRSIL